MPENPEEATTVVTVGVNVTIPPRTELVIDGHVSSARAPKVGLLTGLRRRGRDKELLVAAALVRRTGRRIPVRIMNPTSEAKHLRRGDDVALLQSVDAVEDCDVLRGRKAKEGLGEEVKLPEEVEHLYEEAKGRLEPQHQGQLRSLLLEYRDIFSSKDKPLGQTGLVEHQIDTGTSRPIKQRPRREAIGRQPMVKEELEKMLSQGVIEPSTSPWASPIVLVTKKDGSVRFCVDYRRLNEVTVKDAYPLPRIEDNLDSLSGSAWFSTLDLASGFWQVKMEEDSKEKTAFCTRYGLFQWKVMPFGLCNAPGTFERLMERVLAGLQWKVALLYLDDVIVFSASQEEHMTRLGQVFQRVREAGLQLKPKKCQFFREEVQFLGHVVSKEGVATDPEKIKAVREWKPPVTVKGVRAFIGLTNYYRRFVPRYSEVVKPLIELTKARAPFIWGNEQ